MKSTRRPLLLALAGAAISLVSAVALVAERVDASAASGQFPVATHHGMAPGTVPGLVLLLGLLLVGVGAAVHDGRELHQPVAHVPPPAPATPRVVHVITSLPVRATSPVRTTSSGRRLELVGTGHRG